MKLSPGELNGFDWGVHMHLMEEWNEGEKFGWGEALVHHDFPLTTVVHPFGEARMLEDGTFGPMHDKGFMVAVYKTDGEGDIVSLRVFDHQNTGDFNYVGRTGPKGIHGGMHDAVFGSDD